VLRTPPARRRLALLLAVLLAGALAGGALLGRTPAPADAGVTDADCFGAASRDPAKPCVNAALRNLVVPSPVNAQAVPDADCEVVFRSRALFVCGWGLAPERASKTIALIGDSHAAHWRPALEVLIHRKGWRAVSMSKAGCPLTAAYAKLPTVARSNDCARWNRAVRRWLRRHPEVSVVFVAQHRIKVAPRHGQTPSSALRRGYTSAWRYLLAHHVRHVIVLRDTPRDTPNTQSCVSAAIASGVAAGPACAVPRGYALPPDPATAAAQGMRNSRVQVLDLTNVFCSARLCLPVIGGALVHRDTEHMTRQFVASLGPLLTDAVDRLALTWRDPVRQADDFNQDHAVPGLPGTGRTPLTPAVSPKARPQAPRGRAAPAHP
jgi:hypothetical protein